MKTIDMSGLRYGSLTVGSRANVAKSDAYWHCVCDCGSSCVVRGGNLRNGNTKSCGCLQVKVTRDSSLRHGAASERTTTPEYRSWKSMIARCTNVNYHHYHRYGGRGITVCTSWRESFPQFLKDMGSRPRGTSLDRVNNDGNYEPGNCRWATRTQQRHNQSRVLTFKRVTP